VDRDGAVVEEARVEELHLERERLAAPERSSGRKRMSSPLVVGDLEEPVGNLAGRVLEGGPRHPLGGGIIIPDTAKEKPQEGKVVAVGNGKRARGRQGRRPRRQGRRPVLFGKYAGTEIKLDGEEHLILREDDILGVVE
jgi:chaperonin GroES